VKCFIIGLILIMAVTFGAYAVEVPEAELKEYLARMEKDAKTIETLRKENIALRQEILEAKQAFENILAKDERQQGFYLGGALGYPAPSVEAIALYKFRKWGVYLSGGYYKKSPAVNLGIVVKTK